MSTTDATQSARESVVIPMHLLPLLRATADDQLELACGVGPDWTPEIRARVLTAARMIDELDSGNPSPAVIEHLTSRVEIADEPPRWPRTIAEADALLKQFRLLRQVYVLREAARRARG
jgi:hypothetical protein